MLQLVEAIQRIIKRYLLSTITLTYDVPSGAVILPIVSARKYECGDQILIKDNALQLAELRSITDIPDRNTITINHALDGSYNIDSCEIVKVINGAQIQGVYIGSPSKISHYPAIAIEPVSKTNKPFTLESTTEEFSLNIYGYDEAGDYEESMRGIMAIMRTIETSLFRSLYPLVEPYDVAFLAEEVDSGDTIFRIDDEDMLICGQAGWIWFESVDYLRFNKVKNPLGNGVYELHRSVGRPFSVGDKVIRPRRHFYNAFPKSIEFGTINAQTAVFKAAKLSYTCNEEVIRFRNPYASPLTF